MKRNHFYNLMKTEAQVLREQQQTAQLLSKKAEALLDTGNYEEAIPLFSQAIELWPTWEMHFARGAVQQFDANNPLEACKDYEIAYKSKNEMSAIGLNNLERNMQMANC